MKRRVPVFSVCAAVCLAVVIGISLLAKNTLTPEQEVQQANFKECEEDFLTVVELISAHRAQVEGIDYPFFYLQYNEGSVSLFTKKQEISLNEKELLSLRMVSAAFPENAGALTTISVYPGRISFDTEPKRYALVYTAEDTQPEFMFQPKETRKIQCIKIKPHWYHVFAE